MAGGLGKKQYSGCDRLGLWRSPTFGVRRDFTGLPKKIRSMCEELAHEFGLIFAGVVLSWMRTHSPVEERFIGRQT